MNISDDSIREQLSAWMDGELPEQEARFLGRRLANDPGLRRHFERMQLASSCLKGQALRPMPAAFLERVSSSLQPAPATNRRGALVRWSVAASIAALALLLAPGLLRNSAPGSSADIAQVPVVSPSNMVASPASADLVAMGVASTPAAATMPAASARTAVSASVAQPLLVADASMPRQESPLPLGSQSPADFPLVETALQKSWPRSPLASASDPALEAYLVRHNQMMANDGLGGFMPYVDVVTSEKEQVEADNAGVAGR